MTDKLKFGSSGAWWSENVCDPGSEFSDRVRVKIGVGLGQGLANQKPYLGPCSQWEKRGFLWPLASVSWCRAGMVELSLSGPLWGHLSFTQMSLAHSLVSVTVTLLGLHVASIMTKWHSVILTIIWSSNTDEGFRRFENKTNKYCCPGGRYRKTACISAPSNVQLQVKVSDTEEVALIFIITPAHDQSWRQARSPV